MDAQEKLPGQPAANTSPEQPTVPVENTTAAARPNSAWFVLRMLEVRLRFVFILVAGTCLVAAGCLTLLDDRRPGRLTPHQFRWLQHRDRRWTAARAVRAPTQPREAAADRGAGQPNDRAWAPPNPSVDGGVSAGLPVPHAG